MKNSNFSNAPVSLQCRVDTYICQGLSLSQSAIESLQFLKFKCYYYRLIITYNNHKLTINYKYSVYFIMLCH